MMHRRALFRVGMLGIAAAVGNGWLSQAMGAVLPVPQSLKDELAKALARRTPLVVMVSLDRCPFCKVARDHYLEPLSRKEGISVVQIDMRSAKSVQHFDGSEKTHDQITREWGITIAPTVLFFGANGKEVAERLVGGYLPDFYGAYLEERIAKARAAIF